MTLTMEVVSRLGDQKGMVGFRCEKCGKVQFVDET
jgi:hypothetical protein